MFHKEGSKIILITLLLVVGIIFLTDEFVAINWLRTILYLFALVILVLVLQYFRNPTRVADNSDNHILAPVDGKVVVIEEVYEPEYFKDKRLMVSIFMSPINVHVTRYCVNGIVKYSKYHPGKYLVAWHPKASEENERTTVAVESLTNHKVVFRQIAGYVARRIVFYCNEDDTSKAGHEFGFIKFGSRMDVFLPLDTEVTCKIGDKTKGGIDVIAKMKE